MMSIIVNEETRQMVEVPIPIRLPKFMWTILYARAKALHGGDLEACVQGIVDAGIGVEIKMVGGPIPMTPN